MADGATGGVQDDYSSEPPMSSKPYLDAIAESEKAFRTYQEKADNVDKLYADLEQKAKTGRDREFSMFWANIEVLKPSIYSRPPVPVVTTRFKDRRPVPRMAAELLERCAIVGFEIEDIDCVMKLIRDDLSIQARGAAWVRYNSKDGQRVCVDHKNRRDFLHELAREWKEVGWVAGRAWLTEREMEDRFKKTSGEAYKSAEYSVRRDAKDNGAADSRTKCGVWEIWHKTERKVIWVTPGVDVVLDRDNPHLKLEGFFPCPRPAYGTTQRDSLIPVPDVVFYRDQLEEINQLTARIAALAEAIKVRGFYPAGAGEIGDAIEAAVNTVTDNKVLIPISNWAAFGNSSAKDMIIWLPIDQIVTTVSTLVELRRQLIEDVYQVSGFSDIMRGNTDPNETLGAQELKSQYGSIRIRDRQQELVRIARDVVRISAEIMAENFSQDTLLEMSQLELKTDAALKEETDKALKAAEQEVIAAKQNPEMVAQLQQNPDAIKPLLAQLEQQTQAQIDKINEQPTIEKVVKLLREQRTRPFILDIETDSTIAPDENAQKQRATEFVTAVGGALSQAAPLVQAVPQAAALVVETLKFLASQFRAGRQLEGVIEEFGDQMKAMAGQPKPPDPANAKAEKETEIAIAQEQRAQQTAAADEQRKQAADAASQQREDQRLQADLANKTADDQRKVTESNLRIQQMTADDARRDAEHQQKLDIGALQIEKLKVEIGGVQVKTDAAVATADAKIEQANQATENSIRSTDASVQSSAQTDRGAAT